MFSNPAFMPARPSVVGGQRPIIDTSPKVIVIVGDSLADAASLVNTDNKNPITAITKANPGRITKASHGLVNGDKAFVWGVQGMVQVNEQTFTITQISGSQVTIGVDTTNFSTFAANGWNGGRMYRLNNAVYTHTAQGFISALNMLSGQRYKFEHRLNRGIGGSTAANLKNRIAADIPASLDVDEVVIVIGANDVNAGRLATAIMADIDEAIAYCHNVLNANVTLSTLGPWDSNTEAQKDQRDLFNTMARAKVGPRIRVWDWYNEVTDLATRTWKPGYSPDGGHPGPAAGFIAALKLDAAMAPSYGRNTFTLDAGNLLVNPSMSGTGGTAGSGTSGPVANGWTCETGTTAGAKTASKDANDKQVMAVNIPAGSSTGERYSFRQYVGAGPVVGQKYVAEVEVQIDSFTGPGVWYEFSLNLRNQSQAWSTDYGKRNFDSLAIQEMISASGQRSLILRTPPVEYQSGWTQFGPRLDAVFKCDAGAVQGQWRILNAQLKPVDVPTQPVTLPKTVQENDASVTRSVGGWMDETFPGYFGGFGSYNINNGAYVEMTLLGTGLRYESYANTSGSIIGVFRNGTQVDSFDSNRSSAGRYVLYTITGWNPGDVVRFQKLSGTAITIDQFTHINGDADAEAYIKAANITDPTQQSAWDTFVESAKTNGYWSKFVALYPFIGGNATSHAVNAINPAQFGLTFVGSPSHTSLGVDFPSGAYADTAIVPNNDLLLDDVHLGCYNWKLSSYGATVMGCSDGQFPNGLYLLPNLGNVSYNNMNGAGTASTGGLPVNGLIFIQRQQDPNQFKLYDNNGGFLAANGQPSTGRSVNSLYLNAIHESSVGSYSNYGSFGMGAAFVGKSMTDAQVLSFRADLQTLMTALGRAV